ncbi:hypothetical protein BJX99DRAFT_229876 [Aspergillus californicus]
MQSHPFEARDFHPCLPCRPRILRHCYSGEGVDGSKLLCRRWIHVSNQADVLESFFALSLSLSLSLCLSTRGIPTAKSSNQRKILDSSMDRH